MSQQEFDFHKDVNEPTYTGEDNLRINKIVSDYEAKKNNINDETIIIQLFFEEYCIEITKRLMSLGYFDGKWEFIENSFGKAFYEFVCAKTNYNSSTLSEFIILFSDHLNDSVKAIDFQKNSISDFSFDRKIAEGVLEKIQDGNIHSAVLIYIVYLKIWNHFKIYNEPFNNNKALLIHRIFAEKVWPKNLISYDAYSEFEKSVQTQINLISNKNIYLPFFDIKDRIYYSEKYLQERNKLKENIERLFEFELTDESESYHNLILDILNNPSENFYKKKIIYSKVNKEMLPNEEDIKMFKKLYDSTSENELGKWLLSKFYLFNYLNYDNKYYF